jgi:hypothetical protein
VQVAAEYLDFAANCGELPRIKLHCENKKKKKITLRKNRNQ